MNRGITVRMCRVKGIDAFGKESYWSTTGYWAGIEHAAIMSLWKGEQVVKECNIRNRYLDSNDRVEASVEEL